MFIKTDYSHCDRTGQQLAGGLFLWVMTNHEHRELRPGLRALVRHVRMSQCGHFMMGTVRVAGESFIVSGTYGSDGLPDNVPEDIWLLGHPLPPELEEAFWNGSEGPAMRKWALQNLEKLREVNRG
jgi:hypothetical protein